MNCPAGTCSVPKETVQTKQRKRNYFDFLIHNHRDNIQFYTEFRSQGLKLKLGGLKSICWIT